MSRVNYFKTKISLIDFIMSRPNLGFQISDSSKKNNVVLYRNLEDTSGNSIKSDQILISRYNNGEDHYDHYFKVQDDWKKVYSVVDFVHEYILRNPPGSDIDYRKIFGILDEYINSSKYVSPEESKFDLKANVSRGSGINPSYKTRDIIQLPTQETFDYLKSRNISQEVYMDPIFLSTYGSHRHETAIENGKIINKLDFSPEEWSTKTNIRVQMNPAFVYLNDNNRLQIVQHIIETRDENKELKNRQKLFLKGEKAGGLFKSNKTKDTNLVVLTEAPEKAFAHYQLSKDQFDREKKSPYYIATGGNISVEQLKHISKIVKEYRFPLVTGFDMDAAGSLYTLKVLAAIINEGNHIAFQTVNDKPMIAVQINNVFTKEGGSGKEAYMFQSAHAGISRLFESTDPNERIFNAKDQTMYFHNTPENIQSVQKVFQDVIQKHLSIPVIKHSPVTKDWVDDLERKHSLKRELHVHPQIDFSKSNGKSL